MDAENKGIEVASVVFRGPKIRARAMLVGVGPAARMQTGHNSNGKGPKTVSPWDFHFKLPGSPHSLYLYPASGGQPSLYPVS